MRICQVAAEVAPFAKTGGLGDVVGGLSAYLGRAGHDVRIVMPFYGQLMRRPETFVPVDFIQHVPIPMGGRHFAVSAFTCKLPGSEVDVYFVSCPELFAQEAAIVAIWDEADIHTLRLLGRCQLPLDRHRSNLRLRESTEGKDQPRKFILLQHMEDIGLIFGTVD